MGSEGAKDGLRGKTLEVYRYLLKSKNPVGIREVQRSLDLSTPSLASYHLNKLEEIGLVKNHGGEYAVARSVLVDCVRISRFLIPRYFFYSIFAVLALAIELIFFRPEILSREYVFFVGVTFVCALAFCFETVKTWTKGGL